MAQSQPDGTNYSFVMFGCVLFAVCLMIYVFMPPPTVDHGEDKTRLMFLQERKDMVYENLRDLNFEYKAGKLSDDDFQSMRNSMEEEAAAILAEIDLIERSQNRASARA